MSQYIFRGEERGGMQVKAMSACAQSSNQQ